MNNIDDISHPIILFDGVCNLCNSSVQFVIKHDKKEVFQFSSLQSDFGQQILEQNGLSGINLFSLILLDKGNIYTQSTAVLRIAKKLGGFWSLLYVFIIVPKFLRNGIYNWIARNRYKWFGKQEACWVPTEELKRRFK
ncbi:thiol-disulfide oxidoreductase DCC family protein [Chitinophagaceae bacterium LWZ2-11]